MERLLFGSSVLTVWADNLLPFGLGDFIHCDWKITVHTRFIQGGMRNDVLAFGITRTRIKEVTPSSLSLQ